MARFSTGAMFILSLKLHYAPFSIQAQLYANLILMVEKVPHPLVGLCVQHSGR